MASLHRITEMSPLKVVALGAHGSLPTLCTGSDPGCFSHQRHRRPKGSFEGSRTMQYSTPSQNDGTVMIIGGRVTGLLSGFKLIGLSENSLCSWSFDGSPVDYAPSFGMAYQYLDPHSVCAGDQIVIDLWRDSTEYRVDIRGADHRPRHAYLPDWHFDMLLDNDRTQAYEKAICHAIERKHLSGRSNVHVIDAGAGSGLLSMLAVKSILLSKQLICVNRVTTDMELLTSPPSSFQVIWQTSAKRI